MAVYGFAGVVYLLVIAWGPTPAFRQVIPLIGIAALLVLGIEALRRKTAEEFPDAQPGDAMAAIRSWYAARQQPAPAIAAPGPNGGRVDALERLATLHDSGALTDAEFASEKATLIHSPA